MSETKKKGRKPDIGLYVSRPRGEKIDYEADNMGALWLEKSKESGKYYLTGKVRVGPERLAPVVGFVKAGGPLAKALGIEDEDGDAGNGKSKRKMPWDEDGGGDDSDVPF